MCGRQCREEITSPWHPYHQPPSSGLPFIPSSLPAVPPWPSSGCCTRATSSVDCLGQDEQSVKCPSFFPFLLPLVLKTHPSSSSRLLRLLFRLLPLRRLLGHLGRGEVH